MIKYGYRKNEWLAVYVDECGDRQIMPFDTFTDAQQFLTLHCSVRIGVMTTAFYDRYVEHIAELEM